jgi:hypothetical protein
LATAGQQAVHFLLLVLLVLPAVAAAGCCCWVDQAAAEALLLQHCEPQLHEHTQQQEALSGHLHMQHSTAQHSTIQYIKLAYAISISQFTRLVVR